MRHFSLSLPLSLTLSIYFTVACISKLCCCSLSHCHLCFFSLSQAVSRAFIIIGSAKCDYIIYERFDKRCQKRERKKKPHSTSAQQLLFTNCQPISNNFFFSCFRTYLSHLFDNNSTFSFLLRANMRKSFGVRFSFSLNGN